MTICSISNPCNELAGNVRNEADTLIQIVRRGRPYFLSLRRLGHAHVVFVHMPISCISPYHPCSNGWNTVLTLDDLTLTARVIAEITADLSSLNGDTADKQQT